MKKNLRGDGEERNVVGGDRRAETINVATCQRLCKFRAVFKNLYMNGGGCCAEDNSHLHQSSVCGPIDIIRVTTRSVCMKC